MITFIFSNIIYSNFIFKNTFKDQKRKDLAKKIENGTIKLLIGYDKQTKEKIYVPEEGLYQNFLITGTIGTGKTSSAMYPFTRTIIKI